MPMEVKSKFIQPLTLEKNFLKIMFTSFFFVAALTALEIWCLAMIGIVFLTLFAYAAILVQVKFLPLSLSDTFSPYFTFICFHLLSFTFTLFDQVAEIVQVNFLPLPFSFTFTLIYFNFVYIIPLFLSLFPHSPSFSFTQFAQTLLSLFRTTFTIFSLSFTLKVFTLLSFRFQFHSLSPLFRTTFENGDEL